MDERNELPPEENRIPLEEAFSHCVGTAQDVIARYTHCAICGANLHFTYATNFVTNLTEEMAKCLECNVKARHIVHRLQ
ncbi:MAG TPA: hypothetical protein DCS07_17140 [Bdellovibrionales bacterium]|nr:MAG: hypothetical protein A2Z97_13650 [Bdellovibrionales bacterium GWB1_52_6]OFZ06057.1 MAG: hypothetical protein A2X97_01840 [Bdellovibrionales bacterium GWA1_52_35]OFZ34363.1 MAG: hypothetical protein A2070_14880 [Bdellovibrionales bacterium GWC1_52_8]HAR44327.1 hypothetical protein [Bdellovibrionales bacterium]HCM39318.1 hypothetical protein [Bdellovibrionales bacterium]